MQENWYSVLLTRSDHPACTVTEACNFGFKKKMGCSICEVKTKVLINCAVTGQLICAFIFTNACCWYSYVEAQMIANQDRYFIFITSQVKSKLLFQKLILPRVTYESI